MSDESLKLLLPAIDVAAFERTPDGAFLSVAPSPPWFARLVGDVTFPFLGHILEEATEFWAQSTTGTREWGPCAEVDESGDEFHYRVTAVILPGKQYLVFQRDAGAERLREVLQKVRAQALGVPGKSS